MTSSSGLATNTRRLELYIRGSVYVLLLTEPLIVLGLVLGMVPAPPGGVVALIASLVQAVINVVAARWALTAMRHSGRWPTSRLGVAALACWAVASLIITVVFVATIDVFQSGPLMLAVAVGAPVATLSPMLRPRTILIATVIGGVLIGIGAHGLQGFDWPTAAVMATSTTIALIMTTFSFWLFGWMLRVIWELEDARAAAAGLAIAEERLRISRDLHDLFGRTLATVAVKSELAAELIKRGRDTEAADEMSAVRKLAEQSGHDVGQVVRGYRETGLETELAGARSLLDSAGIRCVVSGGPPADLNPDLASALVWILRESVTNVIRHSKAHECFITVNIGDPLRLIVTNDGAGHGPLTSAATGGSGLVGMSQRLVPFGGALTYGTVAGRFTVEAVVPAPRPQVLEVLR